MENFKDEISKEVLEILTMEDLYKSPNLKKLVKEKYPRAYLSITEPYREFGLYSFIKLAELHCQYSLGKNPLRWLYPAGLRKLYPANKNYKKSGWTRNLLKPENSKASQTTNDQD